MQAFLKQRVSVAVATYNGAPFVIEQLDSLKHQSRVPDEIVIADDASGDNTLELVRDWAVDAPMAVRVLPGRERRGYAENFARALGGCRGDVIFLCDQDDAWFPSKVSAVLEYFAEHPDAMLILNDAEFADQSLRSTGLTKIQQFEKAALNLDNYVMGCCMAIKRELLDVCQPIPVRALAHDCWLSDLALMLGVRRIYDRPLQYYRRHGENASTTLFNSTRPIKRVDVYLHGIKQLLQANDSGLASLVTHQESIVDRLQTIRSFKARFDSPALDSRLRSLIEQIDFSRRRLQIRDLPRLKRTVEAYRLHFATPGRGSRKVSAYMQDVFAP